jgi:hypothetical protein
VGCAVCACLVLGSRCVCVLRFLQVFKQDPPGFLGTLVAVPDSTLPLSIQLVFFIFLHFERERALRVHSKLLWIFVCASYSFIFCCPGADFQGIGVGGVCKALHGGLSMCGFLRGIYFWDQVGRSGLRGQRLVGRRGDRCRRFW